MISLNLRAIFGVFLILSAIVLLAGLPVVYDTCFVPSLPRELLAREADFGHYRYEHAEPLGTVWWGYTVVSIALVAGSLITGIYFVDTSGRKKV